MDGCRSRKVRRILHHEAQAARLLASYESHMVRLTPTRHRAEQHLQEARALKMTLSNREISELRHIRSGV